MAEEPAVVPMVEDAPIIEEIDELRDSFELLEEQGGGDADQLLTLLRSCPLRVDDVAVKIKEKILTRLARLYSQAKRYDDVMGLLKQNDDFFGAVPKAKTAKIVRSILTIVAEAPDSLDVQVKLCKDVIEWCKAEKRTFLRQRVEAKLATLLLDQKDLNGALALVNSLLYELKKLDDKQMLTEVHLTEARVYHALQNIPKSKSSLTASRTAANSIYVVPLLQAELDEMSGILHCEEGDNGTAFSYFLEAFEAYDPVNDPRAVKCLKYMILAKVLSNQLQEVPALLSGKFALKHTGPDLEAMAAITRAAKSRSLEDFKAAVAAHEARLKTDNLISHHLDVLYESMFEANLLKIIHPFSSVEIAHVARRINLKIEVVEKKLSQMILDHRFSGILDQGRGHLVIFDHSTEDVSFSKGLEVVENMNKVVEVLVGRAQRLNKAT